MLKHCSYWVLKNETYEFFLQSPLRRRGGRGFRKWWEKSTISDEMHLWMTPNLSCMVSTGSFSCIWWIKKKFTLSKIVQSKGKLWLSGKVSHNKIWCFQTLQEHWATFFFLQDCLIEIFKLILLAYYDIYWLFLEGVVWVVGCFSIFLYDGYNFAILQF